MGDSNLSSEINKRRTFAIISHPDAGKTTITEPGHYKAVVYLYDAKTGNVGVDRAMFEIPEAE